MYIRYIIFLNNIIWKYIIFLIIYIENVNIKLKRCYTALNITQLIYVAEVRYNINMFPKECGEINIIHSSFTRPQKSLI